MDDPVFGDDGRVGITRTLQGGQKVSPEHFCQGNRVEQVFAFTVFPLSAAFVEATAGHDQMEMWMIVQAARVGMQHRRYTEVAAPRRSVAGEALQGADGALEQQGIDLLLMLPGQGAQFTGQGEGHHEILDRQQLLALSVEPGRRVVVLAAGTTAMAAGIETGLRQGAGWTMQQDFPVALGAAVEHGREGALLCGCDLLGIARLKTRKVMLE